MQKKSVIIWLFFILLLAQSVAEAQITNYLGDESDLYAETKQVNQFFRRFNNEEDKKGDKYDPSDKRFRANDKARRDYIDLLFDKQAKNMNSSTKNNFIDAVMKKEFFLNFHGGQWFAQVEAVFTYEGREQDITLFMEIQSEEVGSKWVISQVHFKPYVRHFEPVDKHNTEIFIHPMSHELDFMNLRKAFASGNAIGSYTSEKHKPDHLTLFLYEYSQRKFEFKTIKEVKFHFFQTPGWYFEVSKFVRGGYNKGWLISNLIPFKQEEDKKVLIDYIYAGSKL
ncbi:MAG: hypothetical protein JJT94_09000 [Bernardetiaceae bacterium]|nr:hypothetical protein [Bernardetiaceae bacterium]